MHELSLATEAILLCQREAEKHHISKITEVEINVGDLSGVDAEAFRSALELIVSGTILESSTLKIIQISGNGYCKTCNHEFSMNFRMQSCPQCGNFPSKVWGGDEFRVVSILTD